EVFAVSARLNGYKISDYVLEGKVIAECQLKARKAIGYDILFAFADLSVEAEAIGCKLRYEDDAYPSVETPIIKDIEDIHNLRMPNPLKDGRMPVVIESCSRLRESAKDDCLIAACVMGPVSIASQIMGIEPFLYLLMDNPDAANDVLDLAEAVAVAYGTALINAGAHCPVVFDPVASSAVIPPHMFLKHESPRLKRMYKEFKCRGSLVSWISIAGPIQKIMPHFGMSGINLATVDYVLPIHEAFGLVNNIALNGNIKPYLFVSAAHGEIRAEARRCLEEAGANKRFILGSGCEVPPESRFENIRALVEAAKEK
ncbi:MAG: uroporphyrinogen decarboxylase family protein, partial [Nitrospirae bacterium]|nr:uroporphyrinogen decarboxylase family protein [Nitrospirota bacterium]